MTSIQDRKSKLAFVTADTIWYKSRRRRVVVEVNHDGYTADIRLEGTQKRFPISFAGIYALAVKKEVDQLRVAKKTAKKVGR